MSNLQTQCNGCGLDTTLDREDNYAWVFHPDRKVDVRDWLNEYPIGDEPASAFVWVCPVCMTRNEQEIGG